MDIDGRSNRGILHVCSGAFAVPLICVLICRVGLCLVNVIYFYPLFYVVRLKKEVVFERLCVFIRYRKGYNTQTPLTPRYDTVWT